MPKYNTVNTYNLHGIDGNTLQVGDRVVATLHNKTPDLGFAEVIGFAPLEYTHSRGRNNERIKHEHLRVIIRRDSGKIAYISTYDTNLVHRLMRFETVGG